MTSFNINNGNALVVGTKYAINTNILNYRLILINVKRYTRVGTILTNKYDYTENVNFRIFTINSYYWDFIYNATDKTLTCTSKSNDNGEPYVTFFTLL
jgi:hypothetical protein